MPVNSIYLLVEGDDDERFASRVIKPELLKRCDSVITWKYAQKKREKVKSILQTIQQMGAGYFYLCDLDKYSCATARKHAEKKWMTSLDIRQIIVVKREIECWYVAGAAEDVCKLCKVVIPPSTEGMSKENLEKLVSSRMTRTEFMLQALEKFSLDLALARNDSFQYGWRRIANG